MGEARDQLMPTVNGVKDNPQALAAWHCGQRLLRRRRSTRAADVEASRSRRSRAPDLVAFRDKWFAPNNAILAVSGDVNDKALKPMLQKTFGAWKKQDVPPVTDAPARPLPTVTARRLPVRLVDKPDATQSTRAGDRARHPPRRSAVLRGAPDELRARRRRLLVAPDEGRALEGGKTYGVRSTFDAGRDAGPFEASTFTRNAETTATLQLVLGRDRQDARRRPDGGGAQGGQEQPHRRLRAAPRDRDRTWPRS